MWWKGRCGHEWKDKVANRTIEGAGCIYCEGAFQRNLARLIVTLYAGRLKQKVLIKSDKAIGVPLDVYLPELCLAFVIPYKGTARESAELNVIQHLCKIAGITLAVVGAKEPEQICNEIKRAFALVHTYINSDSEDDILFCRERFMKWQER